MSELPLPFLPYLSTPLFDLAPVVVPMKRFICLHANLDIEHRRAGLSPARPIPSTFLLPSFLLTRS